MSKQNERERTAPHLLNASASPSIWFCMLELALRRDDRREEAIARSKLWDLGVSVLVDRDAGFLRSSSDAGR